MLKIYACLAGDWVCLTDDPDCTIGENKKSPSVWWEENASIYSPGKRPSDLLDSFYGLDYVHISYKGNDWRINPIYIQIVNAYNFVPILHNNVFICNTYNQFIILCDNLNFSILFI